MDNSIFERKLIGRWNELTDRRWWKVFCNADFNITAEVKVHLEYQANKLLVVKDFAYIRTEGQKMLCFSESEPDCVKCNYLKEDIPDRLRDWIEEVKETGTRKHKSLLHNLWWHPNPNEELQCGGRLGFNPIWVAWLVHMITQLKYQVL